MERRGRILLESARGAIAHTLVHRATVFVNATLGPKFVLQQKGSLNLLATCTHSTRRLPARTMHTSSPPHAHSPAVPQPHLSQHLARASPRPRDPSILLLSPRCIFYASPKPRPAQHQQHHCDPAQTLRNHSPHTTSPLPPPISLTLPATAQITPNPPPQPRVRSQQRPRDPIFALATPLRSHSPFQSTARATFPHCLRPNTRDPDQSS